MRLDLPFAALRRLGPRGLAICLLALVSLARAGDSLENESVTAVFGPTGLTELKDKSAARARGCSWTRSSRNTPRKS